MARELNVRLIWIVLGWFWVVVTIYLSLTPNPPPATMSLGDKIGHLLAYASLMGWWHQIDRNAYRLALIFILMGLFLEILQNIGGSRQADIFDMAANTIGVGIGWFFARFAWSWSNRALAA
jgi:VanZ family protein